MTTSAKREGLPSRVPELVGEGKLASVVANVGVDVVKEVENPLEEGGGTVSVPPPDVGVGVTVGVLVVAVVSEGVGVT